MGHTHPAKATRERKEQNPELYCRDNRCLYRTATLTPDRQSHLLHVNPCPKHERLRLATVQNISGGVVLNRYDEIE